MGRSASVEIISGNSSTGREDIANLVIKNETSRVNKV